MDKRKFFFQNTYTTLFFCAKKDTILQKMDGYNLSGEINSLPIKTSNA